MLQGIPYGIEHAASTPQSFPAPCQRRLRVFQRHGRMLTAVRARMTAPIAVLLVEDDPDEARLVAEALTDDTDNTCTVRVVANLAAALDALRAGAIDVVLLDLGLSDSQGAATFDAVHRQAPDVPIIVITGHGNADLGLRLVRRGAQDFLVKGSVDGGATMRSIRYSLERATSVQTLRRARGAIPPAGREH